VFQRMSTNALFFTWEDHGYPTGAIGWVVFDTIINGLAGGGIFMAPTATLEETRKLAKNMTKKFTVTNPQIGGAKAGIRFDHTDMSTNRKNFS
jgi:glutamate dehydrogenase (NAD(P)+)